MISESAGDIDNKFQGRDSAFYINRRELDAILSVENASDAMYLFVLLVSQHAHIKGKTFALDFDGMRRSKTTNLSKPRLRAARRALQKLGLLELASNHQAGTVHQKFRLLRSGKAPRFEWKKETQRKKEDDAIRINRGYRADVFEIEDVVDDE
jgi:hypothetical protein